MDEIFDNRLNMAFASVDTELCKLTGPPGPHNTGTQIVIEKICGFELFNTYPYHNYETWADGYKIYAPNILLKNYPFSKNLVPLSAAAENLSTAYHKFKKLYLAHKEHPDLAISELQTLIKNRG